MSRYDLQPLAKVWVDGDLIAWATLSYQASPGLGGHTVQVGGIPTDVSITRSSAIDVWIGYDMGGGREVGRRVLESARMVTKNRQIGVEEAGGDTLSVSFIDRLSVQRRRTGNATEAAVDRVPLDAALALAYVDRLGFDRVVTNLPPVEIPRVRFDRRTAIHSTAQRLCALWDPVTMEDTEHNRLLIFNVAEPILGSAGPLPLAHARVRQIANAAREPVNQVEIRYRPDPRRGGVHGDGGCPPGLLPWEDGFNPPPGGEGEDGPLTPWRPGEGIRQVAAYDYPGGSGGGSVGGQGANTGYNQLPRLQTDRVVDINPQAAGYTISESYYYEIFDNPESPAPTRRVDIGGTEREFAGATFADGYTEDDQDFGGAQSPSGGVLVGETATLRRYMPGTNYTLPIGSMTTTSMLAALPGGAPTSDASPGGAAEAPERFFMTTEQEIVEVKYNPMNATGTQWRKRKVASTTSGLAVYPEQRPLMEVAASQAVDTSGSTAQELHWRKLRTRVERYFYSTSGTTVVTVERDLLTGHRTRSVTHEDTGISSVQTTPSAADDGGDAGDVVSEWVTDQASIDDNGSQVPRTLDGTEFQDPAPGSGDPGGNAGGGGACGADLPGISANEVREYLLAQADALIERAKKREIREEITLPGFVDPTLYRGARRETEDRLGIMKEYIVEGFRIDFEASGRAVMTIQGVRPDPD